MQHTILEDIIRKYVNLSAHPNSKGWYPVLCKVCNDHGRKGLRAAFNFKDHVTSYHCFNCGHVAVYDPENSKNLDDRMIKVLNSFGIPEEEWQGLILNELYARNKREKSPAGTKQINNIEIEPAELLLPNHFYRLGPEESTDKWTIIARDYLRNDRGIDPDAYPFYLSTGEGEPENKKWLGRVIVPLYKDNKLIYYMGRSLTNKVVKKYLSPDFEKNRVLHGYDEILRVTNDPLYVVEGWFDAYCINGVAVLGNRLTPEQVLWLKKSSRPKVIIPDRYGDGARLAYQGLKQGWSVSIPDFLSHGDCKDVNEAVVKYGKLYVIKSIVEHTQSGFMAETAIKLFCKKKR